MTRLFGTDGIRGEANKGYMTAEIAMRLGQALKAILSPNKKNYRVLIGKDTRLSCYMLEPAITAGLVSVGIDVMLLGPIPTPAVSMLTKSMRADVGIMISASHNEYMYNGIKLFDQNGNKLSEEFERKIEQIIADNEIKFLVNSAKIGRVQRLDDAKGRYIEFVKRSFSKNLRLDGIKIAIDTANGASYNIAGQIFWELGAEVINFANKPNGVNINKKSGVGSPEFLAKIVQEEKCDIGIILDGDADRVVIIDEKGKAVDGDQIIALLAKYFVDEKKLNNNIIVTTIMSNLGLEKYLDSLKIKMLRSDIGDKNVASLMRKYNSNFGGEQSGHLIIADYVSTGDGLISALQILEIMLKTNRKISEICDVFTPYIQLKKDIKINTKIIDIVSQEFESFLNMIKDEFKDKARIIVRKSGTEPLIRIMIESKDPILSENIMNNIKSKISANF